MYVLIKEVGEYSSMDYIPIATFSDEEEAEKYKSLYEYELKLKNKIASIYGRYNEQASFIIHVVPEETNTINLEKEIAMIEERYKKELAASVDWQIHQNQEKILNKLSKLEDQKTMVYDFIQWWDEQNDNKDNLMDDIKLAKLKEIKYIMSSYLTVTMDQTVINWIQVNNLNFSLI